VREIEEVGWVTTRSGRNWTRPSFFLGGGEIDAYTVGGHVPDICNVCLRPNEFTDIFTAASDATFCAVTLDT